MRQRTLNLVWLTHKWDLHIVHTHPWTILKIIYSWRKKLKIKVIKQLKKNTNIFLAKPDYFSYLILVILSPLASANYLFNKSVFFVSFCSFKRPFLVKLKSCLLLVKLSRLIPSGRLHPDVYPHRLQKDRQQCWPEI